MGVSLSTLMNNPDEVTKMTMAYLCQTPWRRRQCMNRGSVMDAVSDVWVMMLSDRTNNAKEAECSMSTFVKNHCEWAFSRWHAKKRVVIQYTPELPDVQGRRNSRYHETVDIVAKRLKAMARPRHWNAMAMRWRMVGLFGPYLTLRPLNVSQARLSQLVLSETKRLRKMIPARDRQVICEIIARRQ